MAYCCQRPFLGGMGALPVGTARLACQASWHHMQEGWALFIIVHLSEMRQLFGVSTMCLGSAYVTNGGNRP